MRNIKLTLEYDGSRYSGWKRMGKDESQNTIENKLLDILYKMTQETPEIYCGSRTEPGVHAREQVINFKTASLMPSQEIKRYLNRYLPMDIAILDAEEMDERFHAALLAKSRIYTYRIAIGEVPSVFERKYTYYAFKTPDIEKMKAAATLLLGKHDFKHLSTAKKSKSTVRDLKSIDIYQDMNEIQITMQADDFLHNMPRIIAAILIDAGLMTLPHSDIKKILSGTRPAGSPAEARGLFLESIVY